MSVAQPTLADPPEGILHGATLEKLKTSMRRDELYHVMYRRRHFVGEEPCATTDAIVKVRKSCTESDAKGYAWWVFVSPVPPGKPCRHAFPQVGLSPEDDFLDYYVVKKNKHRLAAAPSKQPTSEPHRSLAAR
eukprot:PhM_4_TR17369/c3_g1_i3/m.33545